MKYTPRKFSSADLRHRISIQRRDSNNTWVNAFAVVPASRKPSINNQYKNVFTFWNLGLVTTQMRVILNDENFGIGSVLPYEGEGRVTQLYCSEGSSEYTESVQLFTETLGARNQHGHQPSTWTAGATYQGKIFLDGTAEESDRPSETSAETVRMLLRYPVVLVGQQAEWNGTRYRVSETQYRIWDTLVTLRPVKEES